MSEATQKRINIFLPVDLWRRLRTRAAQTDALMSTVVVTALEEHLHLEPTSGNGASAKSQEAER